MFSLTIDGTVASTSAPLECYFGPLREFVLNNSDHPNHTVSPTASTPAWSGATPTRATPRSSPLSVKGVLR